MSLEYLEVPLVPRAAGLFTQWTPLGAPQNWQVAANTGPGMLLRSNPGVAGRKDLYECLPGVAPLDAYDVTVTGRASYTLINEGDPPPLWRLLISVDGVTTVGPDVAMTSAQQTVSFTTKISSISGLQIGHEHVNGIGRLAVDRVTGVLRLTKPRWRRADRGLPC